MPLPLQLFLTRSAHAPLTCFAVETAELSCRKMYSILVKPLSLDIVSKALCCQAVCPPRSYFRFCKNALNNFDKTNREYSLSPTDDLIRFWRSKVKVTGRGCWVGHIDVYLLVLDNSWPGWLIVLLCELHCDWTVATTYMHHVIIADSVSV